MSVFPPLFPAPALRKAATIKLMGFDVDGVLTDGLLYYSSRGDEMKAFNSQDGHGLKMLMQAGLQVALISGRSSAALTQRAANLGISLLRQGVEDKRAELFRLLEQLQLTPQQAGYMGDDVVDWPILSACGFSATVADGHAALKQRVDFVSRWGGGRGAAREVCELVLTAQGQLAAALAPWLDA